MRRSTSPRRLHRAVLAPVAAAVTLLAGQAVPAHAAPPAPQLSISVDNGRATARAGDKLSYTITVTNLGAKSVTDLVVSQTVPAGATLVSADGKGQRKSHAVTWVVDVKASAKATVHSTLTVARGTPKDLLRLATVACAKVTAKGPPLVCAADSDQLPAGAAAEAASAQATVPGTPLTGIKGQILGAGAATVGFSLLAAWVLRRRRA